MKKKLITIILCLIIISSFVFFLFFFPLLADRTAPWLTITGIAEGGEYNGNITLDLYASDEGQKIAELTVRVDNRVLLSQSPASTDVREQLIIRTADFEEGRHRLQCQVYDSSFRGNRASTLIYFIVDRSPPMVELANLSNTVSPGDVYPALLEIKNEKSVHLSGRFLSRDLRFISVPGYPGKYRALAPVDALQKSGKFPLHITAGDSAGNRTETDFSINVTYKAFPRETVILPESRSGLLNNRKASNTNRIKLEEAFSYSREEQLWEGPFLRPSGGRVSSVFGIRRVYNDGIVGSYHRGLDIANKTGTPVLAANSGWIVLAEELPLHGNIVVIDHGLEFFSMYAHMDEILVMSDTPVAKGTVVGKIGHTGFSTGPHLHWELRMNGVPVNHGQWEEHMVEYH